MLVCGCGRWMHTQGIEERLDESGAPSWFVRSECCGCHWKVGVDVSTSGAATLIDRVLWTDEALHRLDRMAPYLQPLVKEDTETFLRRKGQRVVTYDLLAEARLGTTIEWDEEAERRLERVPAPVRAMARVELERTAADRGLPRVTVALMEETKAKYFGMAAQKP